MFNGLYLPSGGDVVCVRRPRPDFPRQAEISYFYEFRTHAQQIFRLHVPMEEAVLVHERQTLEYLINHVLYYWFRKQFVPGH